MGLCQAACQRSTLRSQQCRSAKTGDGAIGGGCITRADRTVRRRPVASRGGTGGRHRTLAVPRRPNGSDRPDSRAGRRNDAVGVCPRHCSELVVERPCRRSHERRSCRWLAAGACGAPQRRPVARCAYWLRRRRGIELRAAIAGSPTAWGGNPRTSSGDCAAASRASRVQLRAADGPVAGRRTSGEVPDA